MNKDLWTYLKETKKPIALYGMGNGADKIISELTRHSIKYSAVFSSDGFKKSKLFHGIEVKSYSECKAELGDMIVLLCFGSALDEVRQGILKIASESELYAPDVPVYGNNIFNLEYAKKNADSLYKVYSMLADEKSRQTFKNTVFYKLTGDINYLIECEVGNDEPYLNLLKLTTDEIYADLGAYRGDTIEEFLKYAKGYRKIYAFEPDFKTFKKLEKAVAQLENIKLFNACVGENVGIRIFDTSGSRGSAVSKSGSEIPSVSIDSVFGENPVTFINMDIEGEELAAIKGAKNTILRHKPKMLISCYHRSEDIFEIPLEVAKIREDYRIYMRHLPSLPAWDTSFYFI